MVSASCLLDCGPVPGLLPGALRLQPESLSPSGGRLGADLASYHVPAAPLSKQWEFGDSPSSSGCGRDGGAVVASAPGGESPLTHFLSCLEGPAVTGPGGAGRPETKSRHGEYLRHTPGWWPLWPKGSPGPGYLRASGPALQAVAQATHPPPPPLVQTAGLPPAGSKVGTAVQLLLRSQPHDTLTPL